MIDDLRESLTAESGLSAGNLQQRLEALTEEKDILEKKLGDGGMRHNRELEEESQKHEAACRTYKCVCAGEGEPGEAVERPEL